MDLSVATDQFGRITCDLSDGRCHATVTASNMPDAARDLVAAVNSTQSNGHGECFWQEANGEYRWVFRREGENVRVAVLWSTGTMTGWEHVFWSECKLEPFAHGVREQLRQPGH